MINELVEKIYRNESVNTMNNDGKIRRRGYTQGRTSKSKKAIVKLTADSAAIEIYEGL